MRKTSDCLRSHQFAFSKIVVCNYLLWASNGAQPSESLVFTRPSILFRPHQEQAAENLLLVEPPGTAPGSEPLITRAFIAIVRRPLQYRGRRRAMKGAKAVRALTTGKPCGSRKA